MTTLFQFDYSAARVALSASGHLPFSMQLRTFSRRELIGTYKVDMRETDGYMEFLQTLTTLGAGFKSLLGDCLSSPSVYAEACRPTHCKNKKYAEFVSSSQESFVGSIATVEKPAFPHPLCADLSSSHVALDDAQLVHESILDELMFWIVKYEFPQPLVTFLLTMLPDEAYKTAFTNSFIKHYSRMTVALAESGQPQVRGSIVGVGIIFFCLKLSFGCHAVRFLCACGFVKDNWTPIFIRLIIFPVPHQVISNRMVHISVQLFSNAALATVMVRDSGLLHTLLGSLHHMMSTILCQSQLKDAGGNSVANYHLTVDCGRHVMKDHCYWPIVSVFWNWGLMECKGVSWVLSPVSIATQSQY